MHEASEQVLRERIEATRARMGETIEELGARVNPDRVQHEIKVRARGEIDDLKARARGEIDEMKTTVKQKARSTMRDIEHEVEDRGRGIWQTLRDNPIPAAMVGVGMAWMMANGGSDGRTHRRPATVYGPADPYAPGYPETLDARRDALGAEAGVGRAGVGRTTAHVGSAGVSGTAQDDESAIDRTKDRAEGMAHEASDRVRETGSEATNRARDMKDRAEHSVRHAADSTRERASEWTDRASDGVREVGHRASEWTDHAGRRAMRAERRVEHAVRDNPFAAGAVAAAIGFAAGLMVPESEREREMLGPARDRMMDRAQSKAREGLDKARQTARDTAGDVARRAVDEAMPGGSDEEEQAMTEPGRNA